VALDGSAAAERVLPHAAQLARRFGARLVLLRVRTLPDALAALGRPEPVRAEARRIERYLGRVVAELARDGVTAEPLQRVGEPAAVITAVADEVGADAIALTGRGRGWLARALLGGTADAVIRTAPCPVLLVPVRGPAAV
jgi:nucleotide-binding universal stress UspA family protein